MTGIAICEPPNQRPVMTMCLFSSFSTDNPLQMDIANASIERPIASTISSAKFIVFLQPFCLICRHTDKKNRPICPSLQISLVISDATRGNPQPVDRAAQGADYSLIDLHYTKRLRNFQPEFPKRFRSFCPECPNLRALSGRQGSRFRLPSFCTVLHVLCYLFSLIPIVDFS